MAGQFSISRVLLWLFVVVLGVVIGGGLYETLVVMPLWSAGPPESVLAYHRHNVANPRFALDPGGRFWMLFTPTLGLLAAANLFSGLKARDGHRRWRVAASGIVLAVIIFTFAWFVPNIIRLTGGGVAGLADERIAGLTNWWVLLNWVRAALYIAALLAGLRALTIPPATKA
jgi:hypothetical protein